MNLDENILKAVNNICMKTKEVKKISLFGSRARGDNNERSDIDLAIYFFDKPHYDVIEALEDIETLLKVDITIINDSLTDKFIVRDSLIQRFEFCYELAWKTLKEYLQYNGLILGVTLNDKNMHIVCGMWDIKLCLIAAYYPNNDKRKLLD